MLSLDELAARFEAAARALWPDADPVVQFEPARRPEFGDVATNVAFGLARVARKKPQDIGGEIIARALADDDVRATIAEATAVAGFINLKLQPAFWQRVVGDVLREGADYGRGARNGERVSLEFGSANPTGPLVVVQGRTLSIGDTLARAMRHAGYDVFTEWIINDAGSQLAALGRSLYARYRQLFDPAFPFPEDGYPGEYLIPIAESLRARDGERWLHVPEDEAAPQLAKFARDAILAEQQDVARTIPRRVRSVAVGAGAARRGQDRSRHSAAARSRRALREGRRDLAAHHRHGRRRRSRRDPQRRPADVLRQRHHLPLRKAAARGSRHRLSRARIITATSSGSTRSRTRTGGRARSR